MNKGPMPSWTNRQIRQREWIDNLESVRLYFETMITDCGPCDHNVNICVCEEISQAEKLDRVINDLKKETH